MTSLVDPVPVLDFKEINVINSHVVSETCCHKNRQHSHVLKSKSNTNKHKCNRLLKRKLKKYKLRRDGAEDDDILDVSRILVSSLVIKSPNNIKDVHLERDLNYIDNLRPKNYLFKMVRRSETLKTRFNVKSGSKNVNAEIDVDTETIPSEDKKHTNAFKLLMDSRNKSIGGNSPGKEKNLDHSDNEEIQEKKVIKAKRVLLLQKMAEGKGSLKNKEKEELKDKIIKKKMEKRADRLKKMITNKAPNLSMENEDKIESNESQKVSKSNKIVAEVTNNNELKKQKKAFKIVDIFNTLNDNNIASPEKKLTIKEDEEFLKKLSPSMKKKESMLSYFKKVDKEPELLSDDVDNDNVIKVKLQSKKKKKNRKSRLSLKKHEPNTVMCEAPEFNDENNDSITQIQNDNPTYDTEVKKPVERQKRKLHINPHKVETVPGDSTNGQRPKRSIKRPIKYTDDACLSSSDDDLHIFTPKKKKHIEKTILPKDAAESNLKMTTNDSTSVEPKPKEMKISKKVVPLKKPVKLAPIFASKQLDPAALEAKQKFLQSGVPDKLKKIIQQQKNINQCNMNFPIVVHVQQSELVSENVSELFQLFESNSDNEDNTSSNIFEEDAFKKLLISNNTINLQHKYNENTKESTESILKNIKQLHPRFPVYRTFHNLKSKSRGETKELHSEFNNSIEMLDDIVEVVNDSPDRLNWTYKYKATSTNQIIGNFDSTKELRKWLVSWTENEMKPKSKGNTGSDSSDYYLSDTDSRDSFKSMNNLIIITGPTGSGKTSSVYAVAAELAMKVIEVNASSKRTGKIMLQDLQEATQSHKVNRGTSIDNSQKSVEKSVNELLKKSKKKGRPKKSIDKTKDKVETYTLTPSSQESTRTDMSLILIDDADIVFDQDDGFSSAIVQLVQCSKRPVILITSTLVCPHLHKFLQYGKILKMYPLLPRLLGTWLDIMCLADSGITWPGIGSKFLNYFKGDIRKTINYLQFYISIYAHGLNLDEEKTSQNVDYYKANIDDESSGMSWACNDDMEGRKLTPVLNNNDNIDKSMWNEFVDQYSDFTKIGYPLDLFGIWWSMPDLLKLSSSHKVSEVTKETAKCKENEQDLKELEAVADAYDSISLYDYTCRPSSSSDLTARPWYTSEHDSVSEQDNTDYYMNKDKVGQEICHEMMTGYIAEAQDVLNCGRSVHISLPGMSSQRDRDRIVSRHKGLTSYLNPWVISDRRSLALDYWASCRSICRIEKAKSDANITTKRNNRFCHYLKSLSVLCKSDTLDKLCDSLAYVGSEIDKNSLS